MHLNREGASSSGSGSSSDSGSSVVLTDDQWRSIPETGRITVSDEALQSFVKTEPIENWYILDPEPIARGQFAIVYHCRHRITGEEFAAKFSSKTRLNCDASHDIIHEITVNAILASCVKHIRLQDVFVTDTEFILIMEYATGGDLQTLLDENVVPYERDAISFLRQLLQGLVFIHDRNIVHLDIKPQNLVLMGEFPDCAIKLCDFEISRLLTPGYEVREILGTPDYVAPEILYYEPITTKTDMWSLGILTYVLLTGFLPFGGENDQDTFNEITRGELDFPNELFEDITPEAIDFMKKLIIREPEQRMSARECFEHPWIKKEQTETSPTKDTSLPSPVIRAESSPSVISSVPQVDAYANSDKTTTDSSSQSGHPRPPLHPRSSLKSLSVTNENAVVSNVAATLPATTPFLNKESRMGSRQNLNRLRSMSKSREVLSERVQIANLKKTLSKSRERLCYSTSREDLLKCKNISQSVEVLTALSQLQQNGALYKSCNNIFVRKSNPANKALGMFQSMKNINSIPGLDLSKKMGYFESRFSIDDDYNDIITRRNTNLNMVISDSSPDPKTKSSDEYTKGRLERNTCRGGRGAEGCDRICSSHKQPEPQDTQKIYKVSRADRMKKDAQKRRKERELREKEKQRRTSIAGHEHNQIKMKSEKINNDGSTSPTFRRGSVCHVEQRLQERHERLMEKQERESRKLNMIRSRRLSSVESDKSPVNEKPRSPNLRSNHLSVHKSSDKPRSTTPNRRKFEKADSPRCSDVSQASSMESVNGSQDTISSSRTANRRRKSKTLSNRSIPTVKISCEGESSCDNISRKSLSDNLKSLKDLDEAYISLEEEAKDTIAESDNSDDADSVESDKTITNAQNDNRITLEEKEDKSVASDCKEVNLPNECKLQSSDLHQNSELPSIKEEQESPKYMRSASTTSDLGSTISEGSEESLENRNDNKVKRSDSKIRPRSYSVHQRVNNINLPGTRNRSKSVHQGPLDKSRPWGDVCSGSIAKALKNFNA